MFILERLTDIIAPFTCLQCSDEGKLVCENCMNYFCSPINSRCYRCLKPTRNFSVCDSCAVKTSLRHVWIASEMQGLPEKLVHIFKFERAQAAAPQVALVMKGALPTLNPNIIIVPLPTATTRIRQRGYDHTALLARSLSDLYHCRYIPVLRRIGQSRQVGATRVQRLAQLQGAFRVAKPVTGKRILLIDDVVTTGASLEQAARILQVAGAKQVDALVFAQKSK